MTKIKKIKEWLVENQSGEQYVILTQQPKYEVKNVPEWMRTEKEAKKLITTSVMRLKDKQVFNRKESVMYNGREYIGLSFDKDNIHVEIVEKDSFPFKFVKIEINAISKIYQGVIYDI